MPKYNFPRSSKKHIEECKLLQRISQHYTPERFPNEHMGVNDRFLLNLVVREQAEIFKKYYSSKSIVRVAKDQNQSILRRMQEFGYHTRLESPNKP